MTKGRGGDAGTDPSATPGNSGRPGTQGGDYRSRDRGGR
jgi:hypothetical protein